MQAPETIDRAGAGRWMYSPLFVPLALLGITLSMFSSVLFLQSNQVLGALGFDTSNLFVYHRQFGFDQLRSGHIALWNPYIYSGVPFMGGFVAALLYPLNVIYLILPLAKAVDWDYTMHVFLVGLFMALWVGRYRLHPFAVLLASCVTLFSRAFSGEILAGHLAHLDSMTWVPLILLALDSLLDEPGAKWVLIGIFAFAMQALAGYPQVLFNTIVTCALYGSFRLVKAPHPVKSVFALLLVAVGAALLATAQLWTGLQVASESTRQGGTSFTFAASFSLPPANLLTLVVPDFCRLMPNFVFFGLTGFTMALYGMTAKSPHRNAWSGTAILVLCIALGSHTPLFRLLYDMVPGFKFFRHPSSFTFEFVVFMAMFTAFGMDALLRSSRGSKTAALALLIAALTLGSVGVGLRTGASVTLNGAWSKWLYGFLASTESFFPMREFTPGLIEETRRFAGSQCLISAGLCLAVGGLFLVRSLHPGAAYLLAVSGIAEAFIFARPAASSFPLAATVPAEVRQFLAAHPGDYRILNLNHVGPLNAPMADSAIAMGASDIWGYDPMVLQRYAQLIFYSQGENPDDAGMHLNFRRMSTLFRLLRLRFVFATGGDRNEVIKIEGGLPHLLLVSDWLHIPERDQIFKTLSAPTFDLTKTLILESAPDPPPLVGAPPGTVRLVSSDSDSLTIAAEVGQPTLLLVTDPYSRYWRAAPLPGTSQKHYQVLPADYALIAVPLAAGRHLLCLEYAPSGWVIGRWVSLTALVVYLLALGIFLAPTRMKVGNLVAHFPGT